MYSYVLFDLDGTIIDPKIGICKSVEHALKAFGREIKGLDELEWFIGPPLRDSFMECGFNRDEAELLVAKYRERYSVTGVYECDLYPGIKELLEILVKQRKQIAIASSKPTIYVKTILEYHEIKDYFTVIVGSNLNGTRDTKIEVMEYALEQLGVVDKSQVIMIGDRKFDIEASKELQVDSVLVKYGYADDEEIAKSNAEYKVDTVKELAEIVLKTE